MGNAYKGCLSLQHKGYKRPKALTLLPSNTKSRINAYRSPTMVSRADASMGSSPQSDLSSFTGDEYMYEQLQCISLFKIELLPFFDVWEKLQSLSKDNYTSFCSTFYLHLPDAHTNDQSFLDNENPSKSGKCILNELNIIIDHLQQIYKLLGANKNMSVTESVLYLQRQQTFKSISSQHYEVDNKNKNDAIRLLQKIAENEFMHFQIGMFEQSPNALETAIDEVIKNESNKSAEIGEFTLSSRGGLRIFFEIIRSLMLQQDLSDVQNILSSAHGDEREAAMIQNKRLIERFVSFWDYNIFQSMDHRDQQLFSLKIYSFLIKRLQDIECQIYTTSNTTTHTFLNSNLSNSNSNTTSLIMDNSSIFLETPSFVSNHLSANWHTKSKSPSVQPPIPIQIRDEAIMNEFHSNSTFQTTMSVGLIPWLNYLVLFLKLDRPKKLFIHLKHIKRTFTRKGVDLHILEPLAFAFKAACLDDDRFYVDDPNTFYKSKMCIVDKEMEECIDFVFDLFLSELLTGLVRGDSCASQFTFDRSMTCMTSDSKKIGLSGIYNHAINVTSGHSSPARTSPNSKPFIDHISPLMTTGNNLDLLHKNISISITFWQANVRCLSSKIKQKLSDKIFESISQHSHHCMRAITHISSQMETNVNIIDFLHEFIFEKVKKYSHNSQHFNFCDESDDLWSDNAVVSDYKHSARGRDSHPNTPLPSSESLHDLFIDFIAFGNDKDIKRGIAFIEAHKVKKIIFKICQIAIIEVFQKYFGMDTFDNETKQNFVLLFRTISSLMLGS